MTLPWYLDLDTKPWEAYVDHRYPVLTLDFETTNLEHGDPREAGNRTVMACVRMPASGKLVEGEEAWRVLRAQVGCSAILVAHNAKFELGWLARSGIDTSQWLVFDTMIAEYVIAGNRRVRLDLDSVARRYGLGSKGRLVDAMMKAGVCPSEMPDHMLRERVLWDVDRTYRLFKRQLAVLAQLGLERVMFTRCLLTPVLADMETVGMELDRDKVVEEYERLLALRAGLKTELDTIAEGKKLKGPQLAELVYDKLGFLELTSRGQPIRTEKGARRTDAATLDALVATTPLQRQFVKLRKEYGKVDAALTKNIEFFYWACEERGGRFVANFNQTRTGTHRLSSTGKRIVFKNKKGRSVQFQNLPSAYLGLFKAPEGYSYSQADGMGLEFRTAGSLARDPQVLRDVTEGADIHRYTASVLNRIPEAEVTKAQRQKAKADTFKPLYGGRKGTKRQMEYYEAFREKYKVTNDAQMGWVHEVLKEGRLRTASGLIFYWPDTKMTSSGWITNTPNIFDYPVQSFATAEIIPVSVVYLYWTLKAEGLNARLVNTVHDDVWGLVENKDLDKYHECVVHCFLDRAYEYVQKVYGVELYVPLGVEYKAGQHLGDGAEHQVSYPMGGKAK